MHFTTEVKTFWGGVQGKEVLTGLPALDLIFPEKKSFAFPPTHRLTLTSSVFVWEIMVLQRLFQA